MNNELAIVGKASPNDATGDIEFYLPEYRNMLQNQGKFVYAWSFNPNDKAINTIREYLNDNKNVFIYLPYDGSHSNLRMHVIDFHHDQKVVVSSCPPKWQSYCFKDYVKELQALQAKENKKFHLWFLIDTIEKLDPPVDLKNTYTPIFPDKYKEWGQNFFAFLSP